MPTIDSRFSWPSPDAARSGRGGCRVAAQRPLRVLIVDNNSDAANTLGELVRLWGNDAWPAYGGATGLATALATRPDVVLLDIAMPGIDGCQLAAQLRQGAGPKDCLLIAVTGLGDEKNRRRCQEAGIDLLLVKPVEPFVMQTLLALERRRLQLPRPLANFVEAESKQNGPASEVVLA